MPQTIRYYATHLPWGRPIEWPPFERPTIAQENSHCVDLEEMGQSATVICLNTGHPARPLDWYAPLNFGAVE